MPIPTPPPCVMPPAEGHALAYQLRALLADVRRLGSGDYRLVGVENHLSEALRFAELVADAPDRKGVRLTRS